MKPKIIAMYLPQYHTFKENDEWWGKGHTEWVSCKAAKSLFKNHYQPRIPFNKNYYDLSKTEEQIHQAKLAQKYNIYGFCYYHYWFCGKKIMEKPLEQMLQDNRIEIPFCISWANHTWKNSLKRSKGHILIKQTYGDKSDWENHFNYLLEFFKDDRYIKVDGMPMLVIYDAKNIDCWDEMKKCWDDLIKKAGFKGIYYVSTLKNEIDEVKTKNMNFNAQFEYQPNFALSKTKKINYSFFYNIKRIICKYFLNTPCIIKYENVWKRIIKSKHDDEITTYYGAYNDFDTTARWGKLGIVHKGASPEKFIEYFRIQKERTVKKNNEFIFFTAWNEWSEGAYLEPDEKYKFEYLKAIKNVMEE